MMNFCHGKNIFGFSWKDHIKGEQLNLYISLLEERLVESISDNPIIERAGALAFLKNKFQKKKSYFNRSEWRREISK